MKMKNYRELKVWQKAMDLVVECYEATKEFPRRENFGLTSQLRRAGVSVPANIAEGHAREYTKEYLRHLSFAYGSLAELETHFLLAERLNYLETSQCNVLLDITSEVGRMINGLNKSLKRKKAS